MIFVLAYYPAQDETLRLHLAHLSSLSYLISPRLLPEMGGASLCGPSGRTHPRLACEEEEEEDEAEDEEDDEEGEGSVMKVMRSPLPPPPAPPAQLYSRYDLDELDVAWLELVNQEFRQMGTFSARVAPHLQAHVWLNEVVLQWQILTLWLMPWYVFLTTC